MSGTDGALVARVNARGAARWTERLHPWIYRSDILATPGDEAGVVDVVDSGGSAIGSALWSPVSTISLRMLTRVPELIDPAFWLERLRSAKTVRDALALDADAFRLVHAEADGLPSLIVDRYADWLIVQFLSAGIERYRETIRDALVEVFAPRGILARDDVPIRRHEKLGSGTPVLHGTVPEIIEAREDDVRYRIAPFAGQKTGAFLDQRDNRRLAGALARGRALDLFSYHGSFALHMARSGAHVTAVDSSAEALERARGNARLNQLEDRIDCIEANAFDLLREFEQEGHTFETIVVDPPAFAKRRDSVKAALRGYKEVNLRALKLLAPGGYLLTFSCSYHVGADRFRAMLEDAAADAGRPVRWVRSLQQADDHPAIVQIPETSYLKGAVLQSIDR
jgi:23S rRNA (cytosine1962-C5)-methyltransferase